MKHTFLKLYVLIVIIICTSYVSKGINIIGSELFYTCTSTPNVYQITAKVYRDCSAPQLCANCPVSLSPSCGINIGIFGAGPATLGVPANSFAGVSFGSQYLTVVTPASGFDVMQLCNLPSSKTICSNCGTRTPGTFSPGVEVYTFLGIVNLSAIPSTCCYVRLAWNTCCQNSSASTLDNPGTTNYYSELVINRCITPCNSSPIFQNEPFTLVCSGQSTSMNVGAIDPDGDSLSFHMPPIKTGYNTTATYASIYSPAYPFLYLGYPNSAPPLVEPYGISLNGATGDLRFTPLGLMEAPIVIEVKQWRKVNGSTVLAGVNSRQISVISKACAANAPPYFRMYDAQGLPNTSPNPYNQSVCAGNEICFTITALDTNITTDTTSTSVIIHPILLATGATLVKPKTASGNNAQFDSLVFCWTPTESAVNTLPYVIQLKAKDNVCPIAGQRIQTIRILVSKEPQAIINKVNLNCGSYQFNYNLLNNTSINTNATRFYVQQSPGSSNYVTYQSNTVNKHTFTAVRWHKVRLELTAGQPFFTSQNICSKTILDSVFVIAPVKVQVRDTLLCRTGNISVTAHGKHGTPLGNAYRYTFYKGTFGNAVQIRAMSTDSTCVIPITSAGDTSKFFVFIQDLNGCKDSMAFVIISGSNLVRTLPTKLIHCIGKSDTLDAGNNSGKVTSFLWRKMGSNGNLPDSTLQKIIPPSAGIYIVQKTNIYGCVALDTTEVIFNSPTGVRAVILGSDSICNGQLAGLKLSQNVSYNYLQWFRDSIPISGANVHPIFTSNAGSYHAILRDTLNCVEATNSLKIKVNPKPQTGQISGNIYPTIGNNTFVYQVPYNPSYQYKWMIEANGIAVGGTDSSAISIRWISNIPKYLQVIATNSFGCKDTSKILVQAFYVTPQIFSFTPIFGRTNDTISINGFGLSSAQMVRFGNVQAGSFEVVSDSLIKAVVALGETGHVELLTLGGFANKPGFTYLSTSIEELSQSDEIKVYPNPAKDKITLLIPLDVYKHCKNLRIVNTIGQELLHKEINNNILPIDLIGFEKNNFYWIEIFDANNVRIFGRKFLMEK